MNIMKDPHLQRFVHLEEEKQRFQKAVHTLTEQCWDICMVGAPGQKLDRKTESCFVNCVERFVDSHHYIINRLEKDGQRVLQQEAHNKW
jgi:import inner membrane translocase subunit TIM8